MNCGFSFFSFILSRAFLSTHRGGKRCQFINFRFKCTNSAALKHYAKEFISFVFILKCAGKRRYKPFGRLAVSAENSGIILNHICPLGNFLETERSKIGKGDFFALLPCDLLGQSCK